MASHDQTTPRPELSRELPGRHARSEISGSALETAQAGDSRADAVRNEVRASRNTPWHEERLVVDAGGDVLSGSQAHSVPHTPKSLSSRSPCRRSGSSFMGSLSRRESEEWSATVSELQKHVEWEKERSRQLERRAAEAEHVALLLKGEIGGSAAGGEDAEGRQAMLRARGDGLSSFPPDAHSPGSLPGTCQDDDVDTTRPVRRAVDTVNAPVPVRPQVHHGTIAKPGPPPSEAKTGRDRAIGCDRDTKGDASLLTPGQLLEELRKSQRDVESGRREIAALEGQNLALAEELDRERQKVVELKRAVSAQTEGVHKARGDLEMSQRLQEQMARLRAEAAELREELMQASQREQLLKTELTDLQTQAGKATDLHSQEMGRLSVIVGDQLVQVERELAQRTRELSEVTEPFLKRAHRLLSAACKSCRHLEGEMGRPKQPQPLYDPLSPDLGASFRSILRLLKYIAEVLAARTGMPAPSARVAEHFDIGTNNSLASSDCSKRWPVPRGSLAPAEVEVPPLGGGGRLEPRVEAGSPGEGLYKRWACYLRS